MYGIAVGKNAVFIGTHHYTFKTDSVQLFINPFCYCKVKIRFNRTVRCNSSAVRQTVPCIYNNLFVWQPKRQAYR